MNTSANVADLLLGEGRDDDIAVVDGPHGYTYRHLRAAAGRLAAELSVQGLRPGARVGITGANSLFWVASYLATLKVNHVAVPFSTALTPPEVARNAQWAGCEAVFLDRRQQHRFGASFPSDAVVITDESLDDEVETLWPTDTRTDPDCDAVLMFTSGTTSRPKAVRLTHGNIAANTDSIVEYLELRRNDKMLVILPFFYCFGASLLHTHLRVGGSLALCNTFTYPETAVEMIEREQCSGLAGVPSSIQLLLRISSFARRPLPSLRLVQQAGGKLPPRRSRSWSRPSPTRGCSSCTDRRRRPPDYHTCRQNSCSTRSGRSVGGSRGSSSGCSTMQATLSNRT